MIRRAAVLLLLLSTGLLGACAERVQTAVAFCHTVQLKYCRFHYHLIEPKTEAHSRPPSRQLIFARQITRRGQTQKRNKELARLHDYFDRLSTGH